MSPEGKLLGQTGGLGYYQDAFIDPVDLEVATLNLAVSDRSENKIIWFDRKLRYITAEAHPEIYPARLFSDGQDVYYLLSVERNEIRRRVSNRWEDAPFIDLNLNNLIAENNSGIAIRPNGTIGILDRRGKRILEFNPLGQKVRAIQMKFPQPDFLLPCKSDWLVIGTDGVFLQTGQNQTGQLPSKPVQDVAVRGKYIYFLTTGAIHVYRTTN